jgi:hypothetical protein
LALPGISKVVAHMQQEHQANELVALAVKTAPQYFGLVKHSTSIMTKTPSVF